MAKKKKSGIKCRATRSNLRNGTKANNLQSIRVSIAYPQKHTVRDMAESINNACSLGVADVLAVWTAMEDEIVRLLGQGGRIELGTLGILSLSVGTKRLKSVREGITSSDIEAKGVNFTISKQLKQKLADFAFECDGIVSHPLDDAQMMEALKAHFATRQHINVRTFATLCKCSSSTADRRIKKLEAEGKLRKSDISKKLYEWVGEL